MSHVSERHLSVNRGDSAAEPDDSAKTHDKEFMATLAKGLAVLGTFNKERPTMTLSQAALVAGLSRATARRILRTLTELGYVEQSGRQFALSSGILKLGFAYLATQNWIEQATPLMRQLSEQFHESCSAAILQGTEIVYDSPECARRRRSRFPAKSPPSTIRGIARSIAASAARPARSNSASRDRRSRA